MSWLFIIPAVLVLASAIAAMTLRNLIHCALCLALTFLGLGVLFLQLKAEFVGFAQILVYVGAVAVLIVFAVLLTSTGTGDPGKRSFSASWPIGIGIASVALMVMLGAVVRSPSLGRLPQIDPAGTVRAIGDRLMSQYSLALEILGLLLTVALIGAAVLAMREKGDEK